MAEVKILIEGYAKETKDGWLASSTVTLIKDGDKNVIVDPGINKRLLLEKLKEEHLTPDDIDIVFLTHYHPDHAFLAAIFKRAITVDGDTIYKKDKEVEYEGKIPRTTLSPIYTSGHAHEHCALLASTDKGNVVIAGDVFWWMTTEKQELDVNKEDPFANDKKALIKSRKKLLEMADWIIPGHGKMFKNPRRVNRKEK